MALNQRTVLTATKCRLENQLDRLSSRVIFTILDSAKGSPLIVVDKHIKGDNEKLNAQ